jgi:hypothetical protein
MDQPTPLTVSPEEYRTLLIGRIERALRETGIPDDLLVQIVEASSRLLPVGDTSVLVVSAGRSRNAVAHERVQPVRATGDKTDQRQKPHWASPKAQPVDNPSSVSDLVLNALLKKCLTAPELSKVTRKPRRAVYNAIWRLRQERLIDEGPMPDEGQD